ncbi:MAG: shikimate dehydrogenase [Coriobacteriia bacterium]|nr:shikimate dehydrogenase [Coriobacteriia bacterium]
MSALQKYLIVGTPIAQSLSPRLHNAVYRELGLPRELNACDPKDVAGFEQLIDRLRDGVYQGLCVTIPYKLQAQLACDTLTPTARRTGAVNYIRREADGSLTGDNTDAQGFAQAASQELGISFAGITAAVCGSGGASRAIVDALLQGGAARIALVSRNPQRTAEEWGIVDASFVRVSQLNLGEDSASSPPAIPVQALDYKALLQSCSCFDLLVNTTPLGMSDDHMPVPEEWLLSAAPAVYDAVYRKEGTTPLVAAAHKVGIPAADGRSMLIEQAICGMQFWGIEADSALLRSIIDIALQ